MAEPAVWRFPDRRVAALLLCWPLLIAAASAQPAHTERSAEAREHAHGEARGQAGDPTQAPDPSFLLYLSQWDDTDAEWLEALEPPPRPPADAGEDNREDEPRG